MATFIRLINPTRLWLLIIVTALLLISFNLYAARFGTMQVFSQKGEPLRAKIEILDVPQDEQGWLTLQSAPQYAYENAALRFTNAAKEIRAMIEREKTGKMVAWLTTSTAVNEEFIDLLLTLNWSTGRMTEAFTLLVPHQAIATAPEPIVAPLVLEPTTDAAHVIHPGVSEPSVIEIDPALDLLSSSVEDASSPNAVEKVDNQPIHILPRQEQESAAQTMMPATLQEEHIEQIGNTHQQKHTVNRGDTLSEIAYQMKSGEFESVTLDQLLWGIYQHNPEAFMGKNMNRLKAGVVLELPAIEEIEKIDMTEASQQVQVQAGEFERYRDSLAAAATSTKATNSVLSSSGKISATVKESVTDRAVDKLQLSRSDNLVQQQQEHEIAQQRALNEAKEKVSQLEKHVADLQKLTELNQHSGIQSIQGNTAQAGIPLAVAKKSTLSTIESTLKKIQAFFSHNQAVSLSVLLIFLVSGGLLLRRRAKLKPLFPERKEHEVPPKAQKMLTSLNLDLGSGAHSQKDLVQLDERIKQTDQISTRLELAQAYWDLGDQQGARQLLEEVILKGNEAQRKQAQTLLSSLA